MYPGYSRVVYTRRGVYQEGYLLPTLWTPLPYPPWYTHLYTLGTVGRGTPCYMPGYGRERYILLYASLYPGERYTTLYIAQYTTLGTPVSPAVLPVPTPAMAHHGTTTPWAQEGRNPWVRASQTVIVLKGVTEGGPLCAEFSTLPGKKRMKDWIDTG